MLRVGHGLAIDLDASSLQVSTIAEDRPVGFSES
jgi:hypothetical protein